MSGVHRVQQEANSCARRPEVIGSLALSMSARRHVIAEGPKVSQLAFVRLRKCVKPPRGHIADVDVVPSPEDDSLSPIP